MAISAKKLRVFARPEDGLSVKRLIEELSLPIKAEWLAVSVNGVLKDKRYILKDGDEVFIMPAGGAG